MRRSSIQAAVVAFVLGATGSAAVSPPAQSTDERAVHEIPNQYIIEYAQNAPLAARDLGSDPNLTVLRTFDSALFAGAAVEVAPSSDISVLAAKPHIARVWPNRRVSLTQVAQKQDASAMLASLAEADDLGGDALPYSTHHATGVDRLQKKGILGKGVKVAVVDTGVWYTHKALGGGFGPGFKVEGGYDFVGEVDLYKGATLQPDNDPISTLDFGHGTHVAGIVAAVSDKFVGVAPNATLLAYKVVGSAYELTTEAVIIDAFLRAERDGADVITASFSFASGWVQDAWAEVISRIVDAGVIVTVAAGNNGADGAFMGVGGGSSPNAISCASVQADLAPATPFHVSFVNADGSANKTTLTGYVSDDVFPQSIVGWPLVDMGTTNPASAGDACEAFPAGSRNLTGSVALVRRGGCSFSIKQRNLLALGADHVLTYNDGRSIVAPGNTLPAGTIGLISADMGATLLKAVRGSNMTLTVDFSLSPSDPSSVGIEDSLGGAADFFSSWSATYDLQLKPDVGAPGGNILSTWPSTDNNAYILQSGTSMSTPYIAGVAALYISQHGKRSTNPNVAKDFHRRVVASGRTVPFSDSNGNKLNNTIAPPVQMGSGQVDAYQTLFGTSVVDVTRFNLNDTAHFQGEQKFTITNEGVAPIAYKFSLEAAPGFETYSPWIQTWSSWAMQKFSDMVPLEMTPDVTLPGSVTLAAGESKTLTVSFKNPQNKGWNATVLPLYSGKVKISADSGDELSVAYMGLAADLRAQKKVFQNQYPIMLSQTNYANISINGTLRFDYSNTANLSAYSYPAVYYSLDWGAQQLRWDIFESDWDESRWVFPPTKESGLVGLARPWARDWDNENSPLNPLDPETVRNNTIQSPLMWLARDGFASRNSARVPWLGHLMPKDGEAAGDKVDILAPGNYTMRIAASKPFADLAKVEGWEVSRYEIKVLA